MTAVASHAATRHVATASTMFRNPEFKRRNAKRLVAVIGSASDGIPTDPSGSSAARKHPPTNNCNNHGGRYSFLCPLWQANDAFAPGGRLHAGELFTGHLGLRAMLLELLDDVYLLSFLRCPCR